MRDSNKPCHHSLSEDSVYKEVVIIGNGPSGIISSFMLSGNVPYLEEIPQDTPIDEMLRARLESVPAGQSLYESDLMELAEGLEGRSQNPVPLLMDNLLNPCADLGLQLNPLVHWKYDVEKQIDHVVLGKGPPGGSWHNFDPSVLTLSPCGWLALPPHSSIPGCGREDRTTAKQVASYYRRYVRMMGLQRYFHSGVVVTSVSLRPAAGGEACAGAGCPLGARWRVAGYDTVEQRAFRYVCARIILACGASDRPNTLTHPSVDSHSLSHTPALYSLTHFASALQALKAGGDNAAPVLVVGSGLGAADAVLRARRAAVRVAHAYRARAAALRGLAPTVYPDYCQVNKMMRDGQSGNYDNYIPLPDYAVIEIVPQKGGNSLKLNTDQNTEFEDMLVPKKVKLLNLVTNEIHEMTVSLVAVLIGSKPDLHFLPGTFDLNYMNINPEAEQPPNRNGKNPNDICLKCSYNNCYETKHATKRKFDKTGSNTRQCFLKNHWYYLKTVLGQSIQSCKSRYWDYVNDSEINGNTDSKICVLPDCKRRNSKGVDTQLIIDNKVEGVIENGGVYEFEELKCSCNKLESSFEDTKCICNNLDGSLGSKSVDKTADSKCKCNVPNPYSSGLGFGIDPEKPIDCRSNPIFIDKSTHEVMNAPQGMYALGPLTADNFVRFICGGALAVVSHIWKEKKMESAD